WRRNQGGFPATLPPSRLATQAPPSQISPQRLLALNRFKQRLEVSFAKRLRSVAFDYLKEHGRAILNWFRENLQKVAFCIAVDEIILAFQLFKILLNRADAVEYIFVICLRYVEEFHPPASKFLHGIHSVVGGDGNVLYTGSPIEFQVLLDLGFLFPFSRFVDGEFYIPVSIADNFRHQRAVFRRDVLVVDRDKQLEPHHTFIEVD